MEYKINEKQYIRLIERMNVSDINVFSITKSHSLLTIGSQIALHHPFHQF